jgi:proline dehydrogenase
VAGETLGEAVQVVKDLNAQGVNVTLDFLGEHTTDAEIAAQATTDILNIIETIDREQLASGLSIKLTQIGLALDQALCSKNLERILHRAQALDIFVRIDMEESSCTDPTLTLFWEMREKRGFDNVGIVIQSYLYRSEQDVKKLGEAGALVRLCKGAYKEPSTVAYPRKKDVDTSFDHLTAILIDSSLSTGAAGVSANGRRPPLPAIATHDESRVAFAKDYALAVGLPKSALEFQMLHGIRRELLQQLLKEGYPVRVYVPFGSEWYPYFVRRLAERPANLWFFLSNFFRG